MSATESGTTNKNAEKSNPFVKEGISEESNLDVVLPYIHSAKEGVEYLGNIVSTKRSD
jgi:dipeptidase